MVAEGVHESDGNTLALSEPEPLALVEELPDPVLLGEGAWVLEFVVVALREPELVGKAL